MHRALQFRTDSGCKLDVGCAVSWSWVVVDDAWEEDPKAWMIRNRSYSQPMREMKEPTNMLDLDVIM